MPSAGLLKVQRGQLHPPADRDRVRGRAADKGHLGLPCDLAHAPQPPHLGAAGTPSHRAVCVRPARRSAACQQCEDAMPRRSRLCGHGRFFFYTLHLPAGRYCICRQILCHKWIPIQSGNWIWTSCTPSQIVTSQESNGRNLQIAKPG